MIHMKKGGNFGEIGNHIGSGCLNGDKEHREENQHGETGT